MFPEKTTAVDRSPVKEAISPIFPVAAPVPNFLWNIKKNLHVIAVKFNQHTEDVCRMKED